MRRKVKPPREKRAQLPLDTRSAALPPANKTLGFGDQETQDVWIAELKRRDEAAESGRSPDLPFEDVMTALRRDFPRA